MKQINLLPQSSVLRRYRWLLAISIPFLIAVLFGLSLLFFSYQQSPAIIRSSPNTLAQDVEHSIDTMKMVGYFKKDDSVNPTIVLSLLELPKGESLVVRVGDRIGSEAAEVTDIQPNNTIVRVADTQRTLSIQSINDQVSLV